MSVPRWDEVPADKVTSGPPVFFLGLGGCVRFSIAPPAEMGDAIYIIGTCSAELIGCPFTLEYEHHHRGFRYRRRWGGHSDRWLTTSAAGMERLLRSFWDS